MNRTLLLLPLAFAGLSGCVAYAPYAYSDGYATEYPGAYAGGGVYYGAPPPVYVTPAPVYVSPRVYVQPRPSPRFDGRSGRRDRDRDRDGVPDRFDRDRDGDGVQNRIDRRPYDPRIAR